MSVIAIIILNYKNFQDTITCINSIEKCNIKTAYTIIVVDNDSQNDSLRIIKSEFQNTIIGSFYEEGTNSSAKLLLIQSRENGGYASGNNIGLRAAKSLGCVYGLILNNDTLLTKGCLEELEKAFSGSDRILNTGPLVVRPNGQIDFNCARRRPGSLDIFRLSYFGRWFQTNKWKKSYYFAIDQNNTCHSIEVEILSGACMMFNLEKLEQIGYLDEHTFLYYEEAIIAEKGRLASLRTIFVPTAKIIHKGAQSTNSISNKVDNYQFEFDSARYYLNFYRRLGVIETILPLASMYLFIRIFKIKQFLLNTRNLSAKTGINPVESPKRILL